MARYIKLTKEEYDLLLVRVKGLLDADKTLSATAIYKMIKPSYEGPTRLTRGQIFGMWRKCTGYTSPSIVAHKNGAYRKRKITSTKGVSGETKSYTWPSSTTASVGKLSITYNDGSSVVHDHAIALIEAGLRLLKGGLGA